ncbi:MAG: cupin domain-containing protein [Acidobacteriaceae bacterium]
MTSSGDDGNMIDDLAQFDLVREIADAEQTKPWASGVHSRTLFKKPDLRVVLIAMEKAARMKEHHADGTLSVQVLKGQVRFGVQGRTYDLRAGNLLTLSASIKHDVEALENSAFLLSISWPSSEELRAMRHRGYGS